jgi:N-methylhydantoinase A
MATTLGVDIGGTFTEAVAVDAEGGMNYAKTPTTYDDLAKGVFNALTELASLRGEETEELLRSADKFAHGTTHTVNAMIQRRGAKTGLITTKGFRDHFMIMKGGRGMASRTARGRD